MKRHDITRTGAGAALMAGAIALAGCVGIHDTTGVYSPAPYEGMEESVMLETYGTPAWSGFLEDQKIYTYKVRKTQYIVCVGLYDGFDYVITVQDGVVTKVVQTERPETFTFLSPIPWAETE